MGRSNVTRSNQPKLLLLLSLCLLLSVVDAAGADIATSKEPATPSPEFARLRSRADKGNIKDQMKLAADYYLGQGVSKDFGEAANWYRKAAQKGDPEAQIRLGQFYLFGAGVPRDAASAARWFALAATSGSNAAKLDLGLLYLNGAGVRQDMTMGRQLIQQAAEGGEARAMAYLGDIYYFGTGIAPDRDLAELWLSRAVKLNDAKAEFSLGELYANVPDHPHDFVKAAGLLRQAVAQGFVEANNDLAVLFVRHPELATSSDDPVKLLEISAAAGVWRSSMVLGTLERDGKLVPADDHAAYRWFHIACLQGGAEAERLTAADLKRLSGVLSQIDQVSENSAATAWIKAHTDGDPLGFTRRSGEIPLPADERGGSMQAGASAKDTEVRN